MGDEASGRSTIEAATDVIIGPVGQPRAAGVVARRTPARSVGALLISSVLLLSACSSGSTTATPTTTSATSPTKGAPIVVIYMENHERSAVVGSPSAPYQNSLLAQGRDYPNYFGVTHPSLPNYLSLGNGSTDGKTGTDSITAGEIDAPTTLWNQLQAAHISWSVYEEGMPSVCYDGTESGRYRLKHNPATPFHSVFTDESACANVKPYSTLDPAHLPAVSFIAPDMCHDSHDCSLEDGDTWLSTAVPPLLDAGADVIVTYDEGDSSSGVNGSDGGGNIYTVEVGPDAPAGTTAPGQYDHYSLLAAIEARFGLAKLNEAANAAVLPI